MSNTEKIEEARAFLKEQGYQTDNLWHIDDVKGLYECTDEQAHGILVKSLESESTYDTIWFEIKERGELLKEL